MDIWWYIVLDKRKFRETELRTVDKIVAEETINISSKYPKSGILSDKIISGYTINAIKLIND